MWLLCEVVCLVLWLKWVLILWFKILFWTFLFNLIFAWPLDMWKVLPFRVPLLPCGKKGINFSCMWIWWFDESWRMIYFVIVTYVKLCSICNFPKILVLCLLISYFVHCYGLTKGGHKLLLISSLMADRFFFKIEKSILLPFHVVITKMT